MSRGNKKESVKGCPDKSAFGSAGKMKRRQAKSAVFLFPFLVGTGLFFLIPGLMVLWFSVVDSPVSRNFVFLDNYIDLLRNDTFLLAAKNTALFCLAAVPCGVLLPLWLSYLLHSRIFGAGVVQGAFLGTVTVPSACVIVLLQILFDQRGSVNQLLLRLGISGPDWLHSGWAFLVVLLLFLWKNMGYYIVLFLAAFSSIPGQLQEAAAIEGAGRLRIFFQVDFRFLSPTVFFVTVLSLNHAFKMFREMYLLGGAYPHAALYQLQHFMNNTFFSLDYQKACAAAILLCAAILLFLLLLFLLERKMGKDVEI